MDLTSTRIFVPSDKNTLIDILLARSVTGESPSKRLSSKQRQENASLPVCDKGKSKASDSGQELEPKHMPHGKATGKLKTARASSKKRKGKEAREDEDGLSDGGQPVAGERVLPVPICYQLTLS